MSVLAPIVQRRSPNRSSRHGARVDLLVWHETAGAYKGSVAWLCNPAAQASAHLVVREDGGEVTQLVPLAEKAWHAAAFNPRSVGVEHANVTAKGYATEAQLRAAATAPASAITVSWARPVAGTRLAARIVRGGSASSISCTPS
jgi:N-acetyl-anhydromuramyl-L-alanine amidase AmpD